MPSEDEKFKALADHYKDTFSLIRGYLKQRDWYFAASLVVLILMLFQLGAPASSDRVISAVIGKQIGSDASVDRTFVGTVVWLLLLAFTFRYFQLVVLIRRQYKYVHLVENALSGDYDGVLFTREGRWYLDRYPGFSNWTQVIYAFVFPALMFTVSTAKIWRDVVEVWPGWGGCCLNFYLVLNAVIYAVLVVSIALYVEILQLGRLLRVALVTIGAVITRAPVDDAVRAEEKVVGGLDPAAAGPTATAESGADQG